MVNTNPSVSLALTVPAVRMLAVSAIATDDETTVEILPVVAISARTTRDGVAYEACVVCPDGAWGIVRTDDLDADNSAHQLVAATWPVEYDGEHLVDVIRDVKARSVRKAKGMNRPARRSS